MLSCSSNIILSISADVFGIGEALGVVCDGWLGVACEDDVSDGEGE